ncbi:plant UBX domain-containing protein 11 isoform X2 [Primulina eburnea]|uniref:plant UBX domain-containing protein 11 isoform X2 n=1 Tax=Primulina eburnea TaxID=1245227 RepID=UPI003C6BD95D
MHDNSFHFSFQMEQFLSSLAFKGTIAEAITEAKLQKKLFVVYIAGDKPESKLLETSTWSNPTVSETLTKYCVFLHISEGSSEASYFSAIYPQNNTPCITVIGYNGTRLWQKGFVSADVLSTSLEKAWLSLHLQETTAAFLTATLASRISGSCSSEPQTTGASSEQQTTGAYGSLPPINDLSLPLDAELPKISEARAKRNSHDDVCEEPDSKMDGVTIQASHGNILTNHQTDEPKPTIETENVYLNPEGIGQGEPEVVCPVPEKNLDFGGLCSGSGNEISQDFPNETIDVPQVKRPETAEVDKVDAFDYPGVKSNNVFFNIRLSDGSLQANFSVMDTLRVVHQYINDNQTSKLGSFDLAIPYPRHVFSDQDLDCTLSALGLFNRQTLIVVPRNQTNTNYRERSSLQSSTNSSSSESNEGYWASVKRILSYVNPFSYLSGGAASQSPREELPGGSWQYNPKSSFQNNARGSSSSSTVYSSDKNTSESGENSNSRSRQKTYAFGANIHTLKRDEDDDNDKNIYWNGNSAQFGGSDDDGR